MIENEYSSSITIASGKDNLLAIGGLVGLLVAQERPRREPISQIKNFTLIVCQ